MLCVNVDHTRKGLPMEGFDQQRNCVKCRSVWAAEKSTIRGVTDGIRADISSGTVWFKDEPGIRW